MASNKEVKCNKCEFTAKDKRALKIHQTATHGDVPVGRPTKLTDETRRKIEEVAALDGSVEEICYYADISKDTYYRWMKENPELSDRIEKLRQRPILKARQTIVKGLGDNFQNAMEYLKRKRRKEFGDAHDITSNGEKLQITFDNAFTQTTRKNSK